MRSTINARQPKRRERQPKPWQTVPCCSGDTEFMRVPRYGELCPYTGLTRTKILDLIKENKVKAKKLGARDGGHRGLWIVHVPSLLEYLRRELGVTV